MGNIGGRIDKFLLSEDQFGAPVGVNYMGAGAYKTRLGGLFTVIVTLFTYLNLVNLIADDINNVKMQTGTVKLAY